MWKLRRFTNFHLDYIRCVLPFQKAQSHWSISRPFTRASWFNCSLRCVVHYDNWKQFHDTNIPNSSWVFKSVIRARIALIWRGLLGFGGTINEQYQKYQASCNSYVSFYVELKRYLHSHRSHTHREMRSTRSQSEGKL